MIEIDKYSKQALEAVRPAEFLTDEDWGELQLMSGELQDTFEKVQRWRTETEMRVSVLNDEKHPTNASKYWQAVKEQSVFTDQLVHLSFDYRKKLVELKRKNRELEEAENDLDKEELEIEIEEVLYAKKCMEANAKDRMRELKLWSKLKEELDDGSFDTTNPNTDQLESLAQASAKKFALMAQAGGDPAGLVNVHSVMKASNEMLHKQLQEASTQP